MLPATGTSNQSQETKSRNKIEEEEKQDENPEHSKRRVEIKDIKRSKIKIFKRRTANSKWTEYHNG